MHVVATISGHGFGHLSISAPVLNKLQERVTDIQLTVITGLSKARVENRLHVPFTYQYTETDFGMLMDESLNVRVANTVSAYSKLHHNWDEQVQTLAETLRNIKCDLVFSNISYLSIAAGAHLEIPVVAASPLNWVDMYQHFCSTTKDRTRVFDEMTSSYNCATAFLKPKPTMPMSSIVNSREIPPIADLGTNRKNEILECLDLDDRTLVLVAMGGHDSINFFDQFPEHESIVWLVTEQWNIQQSNVSSFEDLEMSFLDLTTSVDLLIGKPGYGTFVEATSAATPILYIRRPEWPEQDYLIDWIQENNNCQEINKYDFQPSGNILDTIQDVLSKPRKEPMKPSGTDVVVDTIISLLRTKVNAPMDGDR